MTEVRVIGAGLAGSEAACKLADSGCHVILYEQKPVKFSPAHSSDTFAELVCSNSFKASRVASLEKHDADHRHTLCPSQ